jgi:hypothetical protein
MQTYLVTTESGFIQEELVHHKDAQEVAQWMSKEYETDVMVYRDNELIKTVTFRCLNHESNHQSPTDLRRGT